MATLVKRSDAPLFRVFVGDDWKLFARHLSHEQCFEVSAVLHAPLAEPDAQEKAIAAIHCIGIPLKRNGWFEASLGQAMQVLASTLPRAAGDECEAQLSSAGSPRKRQRVSKGTPPVAEAVVEQCPDSVPPLSAGSAAPVEAAESPASCAASVPSSPGSCVIGEDDACETEGAFQENADNDPLWGYVVPCSSREAAKAVDLRAALEARWGKETAKSLLASTKATVALDASGKKNRVLKLGGSYVKLAGEL